MLNYTLSYSLSPKTGKCLFSNRNLNAATFFTLLHWSSSNVIILYCLCRKEFYKGGRGQKSPYSTEQMSFFRKLADQSSLKIHICYSLSYLFSHLVETSEPSAEYWFLWYVKSGWSWTLEQAKAVPKAEPCPQPLLCSQINFCRVSNKINQTSTVPGSGGTELWGTPGFSFSYAPY